jgi:hypothetical protein
MKYMILSLIFFTSLAANSHSGGTNASGCHTNSKTGNYHCHTPKKTPTSKVLYCHVLNGEKRCGYAYSTCKSLVNKHGGSCSQS